MYGMETFDEADRRVGLVDLDDLASLLEDAGFTVISGPTISEAAKAIIDEWSNGSFPILVADSESPALHRWVTNVASHKSQPSVSVLTETETPEHINHDAIGVVPMPVKLAELAEEAHLGEIDEAHAELTYPESEDAPEHDDVIAETLPSFTDDEDDSDDEDWDSTAAAEAQQDDPEPSASVDDDGDEWDSTPTRTESRSSRRPARRDAAPEPEPEPEAEARPEPEQRSEPDDEDPYEKGLFNVVPESESDDEPLHLSASSLTAREETDDDDLGELFATSGSSKARRCPVISTVSGTGGVGKSTASIQLATAAAAAGYRTVLVDGDRGQGDLETYLRLNTSGLEVPTIADTVGGHAKAREVVLTADKITKLRAENAEPVPDKFALVRAPDHRDTTEVTPQRYLALINKLREQVDIVIVDSPILKSDDHTGVARRLIIPLLEDGGFSLSISDNSDPGMKNLSQRLNTFAEHGISRRKMLITINAADPSALRDLDTAARAKLHGRQGIYVGTIGFDRRINKKMRSGSFDLKNRQLDQVIYETLYRVTGDTAFDLDFGIEHHNEDEATGGGFFSRLMWWRR